MERDEWDKFFEPGEPLDIAESRRYLDRILKESGLEAEPKRPILVEIRSGDSVEMAIFWWSEDGRREFYPIAGPANCPEYDKKMIGPEEWKIIFLGTVGQTAEILQFTSRPEPVDGVICVMAIAGILSNFEWESMTDIPYASQVAVPIPGGIPAYPRFFFDKDWSPGPFGQPVPFPAIGKF